MPEISIIVLSWDGLDLTTRCVESLRANTTGECEIVIVDNGSQPFVQATIPDLADRWVLNAENRGFAAGMNQGLEMAGGRFVCFANNDTVFPPDWDSLLLETLTTRPGAGLAVPGVTASGNPKTVRHKPGTEVERLLPFSEPPSGIVYLMRTEVIRSLGGWATDYRIASGEDWDLCFALWLNGMEIYYDTRVVVEHVSKGTASVKLGDWRSLWRENRNRFLVKWGGELPAPVIGDPETIARRSEELRVAIEWMRQFYHTRDELIEARSEIDEMTGRIGVTEKRIRVLTRQATLRFQLRAIPHRAVRKARHLVGRLRPSGSDQPQGPGDHGVD